MTAQELLFGSDSDRDTVFLQEIKSRSVLKEQSSLSSNFQPIFLRYIKLTLFWHIYPQKKSLQHSPSSVVQRDKPFKNINSAYTKMFSAAKIKDSIQQIFLDSISLISKPKTKVNFFFFWHSMIFQWILFFEIATFIFLLTGLSELL